MAETITSTSPSARRFLRRVTIATGGGMFIDGFVFASFASALAGAGMDRAIGISTLWATLISSSTLVGTFVGGLALGYVTDKLGRRPMFTIDLCVFLVCALLMFLVTAPWQVAALGLVMGLAIGADYAIGSPLLSEFTPDATRGNFLGVLEILWNVGYVVAYLFGFIINSAFPGAWKITLAASAVPAIICLIVRHGLPESPRWLLSKGRTEEAHAIIDRELGYDRREDFTAEEAEPTRYRLLFDRAYLARTIFACMFWIGIVTPYFALTFFQSTILRDLGLGDSALLGALIGTVVALIGAATGWFLVDRIGRRPLLIYPMTVCGILLLGAAFSENLPTFVGALCFFGYLFSYGLMSILPGIYPMEVFPTSVRTSGAGLASAASRVGAAVGTFALPLMIAGLGLPFALATMAVVSLACGVASHYMAPETNGKPLRETSARVVAAPIRSRPLPS